MNGASYERQWFDIQHL